MEDPVYTVEQWNRALKTLDMMMKVKEECDREDAVARHHDAVAWLGAILVTMAIAVCCAVYQRLS